MTMKLPQLKILQKLNQINLEQKAKFDLCRTNKDETHMHWNLKWLNDAIFGNNWTTMWVK